MQSFGHCFVLSSSVRSAGVMAVLSVLLLSMLLLSLLTPGGAYPPCPASCRCYSLTVECGSTGLQNIPKHIPPSTQVESRSGCNTLTNVITACSGVYLIISIYHIYLTHKRKPLSIQTIFLQDNVIGQIRRQDLPLLRHLHYLYLQVTHTNTHTHNLTCSIQFVIHVLIILKSSLCKCVFCKYSLYAKVVLCMLIEFN